MHQKRRCLQHVFVCQCGACDSCMGGSAHLRQLIMQVKEKQPAAWPCMCQRYHRSTVQQGMLGMQHASGLYQAICGAGGLTRVALTRTLAGIVAAPAPAVVIATVVITAVLPAVPAAAVVIAAGLPAVPATAVPAAAIVPAAAVALAVALSLAVVHVL